MAHIRRLASDRYSAQVYLGRDPLTRKTRWESKTFDKQSDAEKWAKTLEVKRDGGTYKPTVSTATFGDFLRETWLPHHRKRVRNAYNTERTLTKWILTPQRDTPFLGRVKLRELTVDHFDKLYEAMTQVHGLRPRGIQHVHSLLRRALKYAVKKGKVPSNPTDDADVPTAQLGPARYLTHEQEARFITAAKKHRLSALWHLLLDSGVRPGEAFALKWEPDRTWQSEGSDRPRWGWIDLDRKLVCVRATLTRVGVRKPGWKLLPPKTENSERDVPINDDTVSELLRWRTQQRKERLRIGPDWQNHGFVFTTEVGTPLGDNMGRAWAAVMREADGGKGDLGKLGPEPTKPKGQSGPPRQRSFTPHHSMYVLRHTMISLNFLDGMDLALLSRRAGHDDPAFTFKRYGRGVKASATKAVADNTMRRWRAASSS